MDIFLKPLHQTKMFLRTLMYAMSIRLKVILNMFIACLLFLLIYIIFQFSLKKKNEYLLLSQKRDLLASVQASLSLKTGFTEKTVLDYSCFDWMYNFVSHPDTAEAKENISPIEVFDLNYIQIYNIHQQIVYTDFSDTIKKSLVFPKAVFDSLYKNRKCKFYQITGYGLIEVVGSTIHPSNDIKRKGKPNGYLFMAKLIDHKYIHELEFIQQCRIWTQPKICVLPGIKSDTAFIALQSFNRTIVGYYFVHKSNLYYKKIQSINVFLSRFILFATIIFLVFSVLAYNNFILKPLRQISQTLNSNHPEGLIKLGLKHDEFGKIARLIMEFFHQRNLIHTKLIELNHANEEMELLNRELFAQKEELESLTNHMIKANEEIKEQKNEIELQHKEITESITYSSIIQSAVLEVPEIFSEVFPGHFIFFKPRNIISGDFYWIRHYEGRFFVAGADCTGHSLAGALLSMLGISFLTNIIIQEKNLSASKILNRLRQNMVGALHQKGEFGEAHGGMDIIMCIIDPETKVLEFAGAYNPLYIVRGKTGNAEQELIIIKGDMMPVGLHMRDDLFKNHEFQLQKGDMVYIMSDGYEDQFGGPLNKKFNAKNLKQILIDIAPLPIHDQQQRIKNNFYNWKGKNEQTDDVLIIGIRI